MYMAKNPDGLQQRFMDNPYSIINTSTHRWQNRKRAWISKGLQSEVGRDARCFNIHEWMTETDDVQVATQSDTSVFDPALCELIYTWFAPEKAKILDCFAGGSVRGIVASSLGHNYTGIELREEQVLANEPQRNLILTPEQQKNCHWICGDSNEVLDVVDSDYDMLFTCPPYGDLEVYSDDPRDISNMSVNDFDKTYKEIMFKALSSLKPNRFAVVVVGDYRDKHGYLNNFVSKTIDACQVAGFRLFNEIILQNVVGTLALRVARQFEQNRKIGKMHQNVLVFFNGEPQTSLKEWHTINLVNQKSLADWL